MLHTRNLLPIVAVLLELAPLKFSRMYICCKVFVVLRFYFIDIHTCVILRHWRLVLPFMILYLIMGIYVLMFVDIFKTFWKIIFLTMLLLVAFALAFYMAFDDPSPPFDVSC